MNETLAALLYLVASVCFIMALRGLSSPQTARGGNLYGIAGMVIAILTTLFTGLVVSYALVHPATHTGTQLQPIRHRRR